MYNCNDNSRAMITDRKFFKVALTGGPCAGKTTLLEKLRTEVDSLANVKVFFAKEAATLLKQSGIDFNSAGGDSTFQKLIIEQQIVAERGADLVAQKFAEANPTYVVFVICDRGIMDGAAYFDKPEDFDKILAGFNMTKESVYQRYDMVLFLRSAAVSAQDFYTTMDGTPRDESVERAAELDSGVHNAWCGHPNFEVVENEFKFYGKLDYAMKRIFDAAGLATPKKINKRYVVETPDFFELFKANGAAISTEQLFFLTSSKKEQISFVKVCRKGPEVRYSLTEIRYGEAENEKTHLKEYTRIYDQEESITESEFTNKLAKLDATVYPLVRSVFNFDIGFVVRCELEIYPHSEKYMLLDVHMNDASNEVLIKKRFNIVAEVTNDIKYSEIEIAKNGDKAFEL